MCDVNVKCCEFYGWGCCCNQDSIASMGNILDMPILDTSAHFTESPNKEEVQDIKVNMKMNTSADFLEVRNEEYMEDFTASMMNIPSASAELVGFPNEEEVEDIQEFSAIKQNFLLTLTLGSPAAYVELPYEEEVEPLKKEGIFTRNLSPRIRVHTLKPGDITEPPHWIPLKSIPRGCLNAFVTQITDPMFKAYEKRIQNEMKESVLKTYATIKRTNDYSSGKLRRVINDIKRRPKNIKRVKFTPPHTMKGQEKKKRKRRKRKERDQRMYLCHG